MRIRSIKPEFWRSPDVSSLSIEDRLLYIGLWSYVDDNGVGQDRVSVICADLFADDLSRDPRETVARVTGGLARLFEAGRIDRYSVDGRDYIAVSNWAKHQRIDKPNKPRYPDVTSANAVIRETLAESSRDPRETLAPGTEEQGSSGTEEQGSSGTEEQGAPKRAKASPIDSPAFTEFWSVYPRKTAKGAARKSWAEALALTDEATLLDAVHRYAADPNLPADQTKIPHASTWLNQDRWEDGPQPAPADHLTRGDMLMRREAQAAIPDYWHSAIAGQPTYAEIES